MTEFNVQYLRQIRENEKEILDPEKMCMDLEIERIKNDLILWSKLDHKEYICRISYYQTPIIMENWDIFCKKFADFLIKSRFTDINFSGEDQCGYVKSHSIGNIVTPSKIIKFMKELRYDVHMDRESGEMQITLGW